MQFKRNLGMRHNTGTASIPNGEGQEIASHSARALVQVGRILGRHAEEISETEMSRLVSAFRTLGVGLYIHIDNMVAPFEHSPPHTRAFRRIAWRQYSGNPPADRNSQTYSIRQAIEQSVTTLCRQADTQQKAVPPTTPTTSTGGGG